MISLTSIDYGAMILYLIAVIGIGLFFAKGENDSEQYLLGGRKMPWMAVGISVLMSLLSTYSLVMGPGETFNHGLSMWVLSIISPFLSLLFFKIFIQFYFKLKSFTPFEYLEYRYDAKVRLLISSIYLYTRILYLGMVLFATAKVFEGGAGWPAWVTIVVIGVVGVAYTVMGGMKAVVWTDVVQFLVLLIGLVATVVILCNSIDGGAVGAVKYAFAHGRGLDRFGEASFYKLNPYVRLSFWLLLLSYIMSPLGTVTSDQITIQRLLSTSSYKNAFRSQMTASFLLVPFKLILWFLGLSIFTYYAQNPDPLVTSGDTALFTFISTRLPSPLPGLFMAAMLAASMSTLDSGINSLSTLWLKEFHEKYINKKIAPNVQVFISRWASAAVGALAICTALFLVLSAEWFKQSFVEVATIFWAFEVITLPAFLFAVFSKRASSRFVWMMAFFLWGMKFGLVAWYSITKRFAVTWHEGEPLGVSGAITPLWCYILIGTMILGFICYMVRKSKWIGLFSLFFMGGAISIGLWTIFSNVIDTNNMPKVLSFQWVGFPIYVGFVIFGLIALRFFKSQPVEKYMGLTLETANERVLQTINED
jgi:SSS family transporter